MGNLNNIIGKEIYGRFGDENKIEEKKAENKEKNIKLFGKIISSFGQVGKLKVEFNQEIDPKNYKNIILEMLIKKNIKLDKF